MRLVEDVTGSRCLDPASTRLRTLVRTYTSVLCSYLIMKNDVFPKNDEFTISYKINEHTSIKLSSVVWLPRYCAACCTISDQLKSKHFSAPSFFLFFYVNSKKAYVKLYWNGGVRKKLAQPLANTRPVLH